MRDEADLDALRRVWHSQPDGESGHAYGEALEELGLVTEASEVYGLLIEEGYFLGFEDLAWLERGRGNIARACELLEQRLALDEEPDDHTLHLRGVLGHWRWHFQLQPEAEQLLRDGADHFESARSDLAHLLVATGRSNEAEEVLKKGVRLGEVQSFLPLANLLDETGRPNEAERLYRLGFALGDAHSAYNLFSQLLEQGRDKEAQEWVRRAAEGGDEKAIAWLAETDRPD